MINEPAFLINHLTSLIKGERLQRSSLIFARIHSGKGGRNLHPSPCIATAGSAAEYHAQVPFWSQLRHSCGSHPGHPNHSLMVALPLQMDYKNSYSGFSDQRDPWRCSSASFKSKMSNEPWERRSDGKNEQVFLLLALQRHISVFSAHFSMHAFHSLLHTCMLIYTRMPRTALAMKSLNSHTCT